MVRHPHFLAHFLQLAWIAEARILERLAKLEGKFEALQELLADMQNEEETTVDILESAVQNSNAMREETDKVMAAAQAVQSRNLPALVCRRLRALSAL